MATQVGQTLSAEDFNKTYSVGTTVSPDEFNKIYGSPTPVAKQPYRGILHSAINAARDIGTTLGQRKEAPQLEASLQGAQDMAQKLRARAAIETDPQKKAALLKVANENEDVTQGVREQQQGAYSEDINEPYWSRGLKTGAEIATTADAINFLTGSPAIGAFKNAKINPWIGIGPTSSPSVVTQAVNLFKNAKNLLHPIKNTGKKLETVRSTVEVKPTEVDRGIMDKLRKNPAKPEYVRTYSLNDRSFKENVEATVDKISKHATNLDDVYKNLKSIKKDLPESVYDVVNGAMRDYANPLQTDAGIKLSETFSKLKGFQKYESTIKKSVIGTSAAAVIWTLRAKLAKLLGP